MRQQLSIANRTFEFAFQFNLRIRSKISSPDKSSHIMAHGNVHFSNGNYETRSSKPKDKHAKS